MGFSAAAVAVAGDQKDQLMFEFPKVVVPAGESELLVEMVRGERERLLEMLRDHSAVLFRGFRVDSAEDFERVVEAFGWDDVDPVTAATRVKVTDRVYTANEAPLDQFINFHHEMALMKQSPSKIFFFCSEPPPEGGETSIILSNIVVEKMEERMPELVSKLFEVGFMYSVKSAREEDSDNPTVMINKTWKSVLKTDDPIEAEKRALERFSCSSLKLHDDGSAEFVFGPMNPIREFGGKRVWFIPLLGYTSNVKDVNNSFGDGSAFPSEALSAYKEILDENHVDVKWQKGDILLLDNLAVQHSRKPGKPPRVVLVSICK